MVQIQLNIEMTPREEDSKIIDTRITLNNLEREDVTDLEQIVAKRFEDKLGELTEELADELGGKDSLKREFINKK